MPIQPGRRLGPYEILAAIGAGGMGEVYRARDTRLDRVVAIKILPAHLADRAELRERFEREAKTIASLNHPHICTLFDTGHQDDIDFLVMEYIEGETLAQRLQRGALPIQQVLQYATEISDALDKAHRNGITHRDLKPGNIMVTKSGAKLLDFGLAKLRQDVAPATPFSDLPTANDAVTAQGSILGTLQYMAPEQVEGKTDEIDARTDIFAFGVVVYEMATGKKAFEGKSQASVIGAILKDDPPSVSSFQPMTPPDLDRVLKICMAKDPDERWQGAGDIRRELEWIAEADSAALSPPIGADRSTRGFKGRSLLLALGSLLLGAAIAGLAAWTLKPTPVEPVIRTVINLPPGQQMAGLDVGPALALSPDGTHLAYVVRQGNGQQIYLRAMDSIEARPIADTEGAANPFFSPDGQSVGFFAGGKLKKVSVRGGSALTLGDAATPRGASWGNQGEIAFASTNVSVLLQVQEGGGTPRALTRFAKNDVGHRWPEFLPGGSGVLFVAGPTINFTNAGVAVQWAGMDKRRNLITGGTHPRYASSGHLIYAQGGSLMAAPFDLQRLEVTGAAVPVVDGVLQSPVNGHAQYSISSTGSLVYISGGVQSAQGKLVWVSRNGAEHPLAAPSHSYLTPRLSPDGRRVAVAIQEQESQTWIYDLTRQTLTRLTFDGKTNITAAWTPDGKRLTFNSDKDGATNIFWQPADGSGSPERLSTSEYLQAPTSWSGDGQFLAFHEINPNTQRDIWVLHLGDRKVQPFLQTPFDEAGPQFSRDGRWLAYISNESGRYEIYVQAYPGPGGKYQISTEGGTEPIWNPNGRELFYRSGDRMMAVEIATQPTFTAGTPRMLFKGPYEPAPFPISNYDVSPDGQRFLMIKPVEQEQTAPTQINVVLNWFEELKQKVPKGEKVMALAAGTRLGSYEVVAQIGACGMGEVYQAHDTKLGRDVTIKAPDGVKG